MFLIMANTWLELVGTLWGYSTSFGGREAVVNTDAFALRFRRVIEWSKQEVRYDNDGRA